MQNPYPKLILGIKSLFEPLRIEIDLTCMTYENMYDI